MPQPEQQLTRASTPRKARAKQRETDSEALPGPGQIRFGISNVAKRRAAALVPAVIVFTIAAVIDIAGRGANDGTYLFWSSFEFALSGFVAAVGMTVQIHLEARDARSQLREASQAEEKRRAIAAIGVAASWDLDLNRLYQRISQDLRSILEFDRFTITSALPTGRMRIDFVSGTAEDGLPAGAVLAKSPDEPDGLSVTHRADYRSRLTAAIPACNGALTVRSRAEGSYTSAHLDLLRQAVAQISPGIANAILFQASESQVQERTVLAEIGRAVTSTLETKKIIEAVDGPLRNLISYDHLGVVLTDAADNEHRMGDVVYWSMEGLSGWRAGDRVGVNYEASSQSGVVQGLELNPNDPGDSAGLDDEERRTWMQVPLVIQDELIGILALSSKDLDAFGAEESALLLNVSLQIAPAIQNANLAASLKRQADERRAIAAIGLAANNELKLDAIYNSVAVELGQVHQYDHLCITHFNAAEEIEEVAFVRGLQIDGLRVGDTIAPEQTSNQVVADENGALPNLVSTAASNSEHSELNSRVSASLGTSPNVLGALTLASKSEHAYDDQAQEFLERVAIQITPAIRNAGTFAAERELRNKLDQQNQELFAANSARKQFLSTVSHELKTPLTIISGFIDLLASPDGAGDEEEKREVLGIIRRNADQLDVLINDILDISRLDAGTFKINPAPFDVNKLVDDLEASFQSLLRTKTQTLLVQMPDDEVWINADRSRITQVITNLLSNASKYSPEDTEITLRCQVDGDRLRIVVADQGVGMTKEEQAGLFTAFFRVDNEVTRKVSGSGLGLVIARSITELHGGEIHLESEPGEGTTIEFWLPGPTTEAEVEIPEPEKVEMMGSRLWPDGPPEELDLGAD